MDKGKPPKSVDLNEALLEACETYDITLLATALLRHTTLPIKHSRSHSVARLAMLVWASKLDCKDVGISIIVSLSSTDDSAIPYTMPGRAGYGALTSDRLVPQCVWAVGKAEVATVEAKLAWGEAGYWEAFSAAFVKALVD